MGIARLDAEAVALETVETLGLDPAIELLSAEGLAASTRRAASFMCPTTHGALVRATSEVLSGLPGFGEQTPEEIAQLIDSMIAYGDLLELPHEDAQGRRRLLFLGPPSYVPRRTANACLLLGIRPEGAELVSDELLSSIEYVGHARALRAAEGQELDKLLEGEGLARLRSEQWLQSPRQSSPEDLISFCRDRLDALGQSGDLELQLIDPNSSVTYYRGRWRGLRTSDDGYFVARRAQAFGADLWCFVQITQGTIAKLIDLPLQSPLVPAADEAWRLQAAIDALAGHPQRVRVSEPEPGARQLAFFSPLPSWMQRRLDVIGVACPRSRGALFAYNLAADDADEELDFLTDQLWLSVDNEGGSE